MEGFNTQITNMLYSLCPRPLTTQSLHLLEREENATLSKNQMSIHVCFMW